MMVIGFWYNNYFMDDELMSTRIVSLKEGHDESHIDDMKLET